MQPCGKDADPDIPIYKEAKAEYAKLQLGIRATKAAALKYVNCCYQATA
jgi:hypothetical protein